MIESYHEHEEIINLIDEKKYSEVELAVRKHKLDALYLWSKSLPGDPLEDEIDLGI